MARWTPTSTPRLAAEPADGAAALGPAGGETLVNTTTTGSQFYPLVAALAGGGYVVVWTNYPDDTRAQLLDATGAKVGGEIVVNTNHVGLAFDAKVEALAGGGFVITWLDTAGDATGTPNESEAIRAQLFDAAGAKIGGEIAVNSSTASQQANPKITELTNGNFLITWTDHSHAPGDTSGTAVRAQLFMSNGTPIGGEFLVNTTVTLEQLGARPAPLPGGGFMVTWEDYSSHDIRAQVFTAAGAKSGGEITVNTTVTDDQSEPTITVLAGGNLLITWMDNSGPAAEGVDLRGQILSPAGAKVGAEFLVNTTLTADQFDSQPLALAGGGFVVAWLSGTGQNTLVIAQLFAADGTKLGGEVQVSDAGAMPENLPTLALLPNGDFVISWSETRPGSADASDSGVWMQVFTEAGGRVGANLLVNETTAGPQAWSQLAVGSNGALLAVWADGPLLVNPAPGDADIKARLFVPPVNQTGTDAGETLIGNDNANVLDGRGGNDTLLGRGGDDVLIGGAGADRMEGGDGSDTYYVDNPGDLIVDPVAPGVDRVATSISYALDAAADIETFEAITLSATNAMDLTGNQFGQTIIGNDGVNILRGEGADDVLIGLGGGDYLVGGIGVDVMYGGLGNDTYYVDNAGDVVSEAAGEGVDRVAASASYVLLAGAEIEFLEAVTPSATDAMDLAGNDFNQVIRGNNGVNILRGNGGSDTLSSYGGDDYLVGGAGDDRMEGGLGNDTYYVDSAGDVVTELAGEGTDRIAASVSYTLAEGTAVERLEAVNLSATNGMDLTGNSLGQTLVGNNGINWLDGKTGADVLVGLGGVDTFYFSTAPGGANVDTIVDFVSGTDMIALDDGVFSGLALGNPPASVFVIGTQAGDLDDRIIYNSATGALYYDPDGTGPVAMVQFATLYAAPPLAASDFIVV